MNFAFIVMGDYDTKDDRSAIRGGKTQIVGVSSLDEACAAAKELMAAGIDCIELCGAFGETGARRIIEATEHKLPVGYVVHFSEQDALFEAVFSKG